MSPIIPKMYGPISYSPKISHIFTKKKSAGNCLLAFRMECHKATNATF